MFQLNPEKCAEPFNSETPVRQPEIEQYALERNFKVLGATALTVILATNLPYLYDVGLNINKDTNNGVTIETITSIPDDSPNTNSTTYFINGIDTNNADEMTKRLAPAMALLSADKMKSVHFNNANYNPNTLADAIIEDSTKEGTEAINFSANSKGGIDTIQAVEKIIKNSDYKIKIVVLNETPDGIDGLKAGSKQDMAVMMDMISLLPYAENSSYIRNLITLMMESDRFNNEDDVFKKIGKFIDTFWYAVDQTKNETRPDVKILQKQAWTIANADLEATITAIGKMKDEKFMPSIINVNSNPDYAYTVDTTKSSENICNYMGNVGLYCATLWLDSERQRHTSYNFDTEANMKLFEENMDVILTGPKLSQRFFAGQTFEYFKNSTNSKR